VLRCVVFALIPLAVVVGCGDDASRPAPSTAAEAQSANELPHSSFVALALAEGGEPRPVVRDTEIVVTFEEGGRIGWDSGCNRGSSKLEISDNRLTVDDRFSSTLRGCPGRLGEQETWLIELITSDPKWRLEGRRLVLTGTAREMELESRAGL
jgi:heat shock protein HslJ